MQSFLSSHHLSGKTVAKSCTHKGCGRGESAKVIADMAPRAGRRDDLDIEGEDEGAARPAVAR